MQKITNQSMKHLHTKLPVLMDASKDNGTAYKITNANGDKMKVKMTKSLDLNLLSAF